MNFIRDIALSITLLIAPALGHSAQVTAANTGSSGSCSDALISFVGDISPGDSIKLQDFVSQIQKYFKKSDCKNGFLRITIDSQGGDVYEALKLGRIIRANNLWTIVSNNSKCHSSCVFLLAAGVRRTPAGEIGIHRPYFNALSEKSTTSDVKVKRDSLNKALRDYFDEMDVSQSLLDQMLSVPPEEMRILSAYELKQFRLSIDDASFNEVKTAQMAAMYNLNSAEYRRRDLAADKKCAPLMRANKFEEWSDCRDSVILEISASLVKERKEKLRKNCQSDDISIFVPCFTRIMTGKN